MNFVRTLSARAGRLAVFLTVVAAVVLIDQATKAAVVLHYEVGDPVVPVIPGVLGICHVENTGAAFSLGEGASPLFAGLALAVLVACIVWVAREPLPLPLVVSLACVAGGGAGNMVDRLTGGSVTDFIATLFMNFPVFNVADIFVTLGVLVTFAGYLWWDHHREEVGQAQVRDAETYADAAYAPAERHDG